MRQHLPGPDLALLPRYKKPQCLPRPRVWGLAQVVLCAHGDGGGDKLGSGPFLEGTLVFTHQMHKSGAA